MIVRQASDGTASCMVFQRVPKQFSLISETSDLGKFVDEATRVSKNYCSLQ